VAIGLPIMDGYEVDDLTQSIFHDAHPAPS
jgi:hypothetical protein